MKQSTVLLLKLAAIHKLKNRRLSTQIANVQHHRAGGEEFLFEIKLVAGSDACDGSASDLHGAVFGGLGTIMETRS